uniref:Uncharacterized protein n=1 Tax=Cucumis melo TaxID=3656 RepID=A0A9I9E3Z6_CUCME
MNGARRWSSSKLLSSNRAAVEGTVSKLRRRMYCVEAAAVEGFLVQPLKVSRR